MRPAIIKQARQDEHKVKQQQQTIITSKALCPLKKNLIKQSILRQMKLKQQNKFYFTRKDFRPVQNKARSQLDKKGKNSKVNKFA